MRGKEKERKRRIIIWAIFQVNLLPSTARSFCSHNVFRICTENYWRNNIFGSVVACSVNAYNDCFKRCISFIKESCKNAMDMVQKSMWNWYVERKRGIKGEMNTDTHIREVSWDDGDHWEHTHKKWRLLWIQYNIRWQRQQHLNQSVSPPFTYPPKIECSSGCGCIGVSFFPRI